MLTDLRYCPKCKRMVKPRKDFSLLWFFLFQGFYLLHYLLKEKECPICGSKKLYRKGKEP